MHQVLREVVASCCSSYLLPDESTKSCLASTSMALFQIVSHSNFSRYVTFATHIDTYYANIHSKSYVFRKARKT